METVRNEMKNKSSGLYFETYLDDKYELKTRIEYFKRGRF
jgi:hypothetical protein